MALREQEWVEHEHAARRPGTADDGGWHTLDIIDRLEQSLGVPVVHPQTARVWEIQKRLRIDEPMQGYGTLLAKLPPMRDATTGTPARNASRITRGLFSGQIDGTTRASIDASAPIARNWSAGARRQYSFCWRSVQALQQRSPSTSGPQLRWLAFKPSRSGSGQIVTSRPPSRP